MPDSPGEKKWGGISCTPKPKLSLHLFLCHLPVLIHPSSHLWASILLSVHSDLHHHIFPLFSSYSPLEYIFLQFIISSLETKAEGVALLSTFHLPLWLVLRSLPLAPHLKPSPGLRQTALSTSTPALLFALLKASLSVFLTPPLSGLPFSLLNTQIYVCYFGKCLPS